MKTVRIICSVGILLLASVVAALWWSRMRVATAIVDRRLAAAGVGGSYRITRIGPFLERMEDVRIGDPAHPDLIARRIDVAIGYSLRGPHVSGVAVDGARLRATLKPDGLHLGALDRLMPRSSRGGAAMPDLGVAISDGRLALETPNGSLDVALQGQGNPARRFRGTAKVEAQALRLASCALGRTEATMAIAVDQGEPRTRGIVAIGTVACPGVRLGAGSARVDAASNPAFDRVALTAGLDGFGGSAGPSRFAAIDGPVGASGMLGKLGVTARLGVDHFATPILSRRLAAAGSLPQGLPITPAVQRAQRAFVQLLSDARAEARVDAAITGEQVAVRLREASLQTAAGSLGIAERGGIAWGQAGWQADGDISLRGTELPTADFRLRQAAPGARLTAIGQIAPYGVGASQLALPAARLDWDRKRVRFDIDAVIDGPIGGGFVAGLDLPLQGTISDDGAFLVGQGCQPVGFRALRLAGFSFGAARTTLCGRPLFAGSAGTLDATTGPIQLAGRTAGGERVTLDIQRAHLSERGFEADALAAELGDSRLRIATLTGTLGGTISGDYSGAEGAIAHVPLLLSEGVGKWTLADGSLDLAGSLRVADAAASPHFLPLVTDDMHLTLRDGAVTASAILREPKSRVEVTSVSLSHRLADGVGHAALAVPGITFSPKGLQPEMLTPLTLGVIANVAGTVSGEGRIEWSGGNVSSTGSFGTDKLDLAAAFGPVSGVKGRIDFTDLLGLVSAPHQALTIAETNPGVAVIDGVVHLQLVAGNRVAIEDARWPFASGSIRLDPATLDFGADAERRLTFRVDGLDAASFVQQLDLPNLAAKGKFDGVLPMIFDSNGGRIEGGSLVARPGGGTLAYVGELSQAEIGTMGKLAFDALKAIRYSSLELRFDGRLDGEMISQVNFTGVREATPERSLLARMIQNLPFRFNIRIRAPLRGLLGSARSYMDPRLLLTQPATPTTTADVQPPASGPVR
ncbi:YdbH domain-containing protein [Sphingomonas nostoxanthinifaciens]|uniref:YdbH domain-containing protein n=1 Tax=Sphingomonas nostoxanthinifaciens TaxID=2872652 RepID=UPI001CC20A0C|nr:YdbH domain-containing protein [Sphingomonas nostoxanthinifaciens]UAK23179.1 YdbH domain-containing protein [Sphingomonas nostoxanthinifaciens]